MMKNKGFTLIELMIVVAIIGVISAVAFPSYVDSITKSSRSEAQGALVSLANAMSRWQIENDTFEGAAASNSDTGAPQIFATHVPTDGSSATTYYLTIHAATASTFTLRATPTGNQSGDGYLELTHAGVKRWKKYGETVQNSWQQ